MLHLDVGLAKTCQCCPNKEVETLISAGAYVSLANKSGDTPLHLYLGAAFFEPNGSSTQMEQAGMDSFAVNEKGETLLHVVAGNVNTFWRHPVPGFRFLIEKGLVPMAEDGS